MTNHPKSTFATRLSAFVLSLCSIVISSATTVDAAIGHGPLQQKEICFENHTDEVYGFVTNHTTYMPIWYVMKAIDGAGFTNTWQHGVWNFQVPEGTSIDWSQISTGSGNASLELNGRLVHRVNAIYATDPNSGNITTYMPIWYVEKMLQRAGIQSSWNGHTWSLSTTTARTKKKPWNMAFVTNDDGSLQDVSKQLSSASVLASSTFDITPNGTLTGSPLANVIEYAHRHGLTSLAFIDCQNKQVLGTVLGNKALRTKLVGQIKDTMNANHEDGVNVDFEFLPTDERQNFVSFLSQLEDELHAEGKSVSVDLPAVTHPQAETWNQGYDFHAIAEHVDKVVIMAYEYSYPTSQPGPIAPFWWVQEALNYAVSQMPSEKVILGVDTYGYDWSVGRAKAYSLSSINQFIKQDKITQKWDKADQAPYFTYNLNGQTHTVYYENAQSIEPRIQLARQYHLGGIALWHAGLEDGSVAKVIDGYS